MFKLANILFDQQGHLSTENFKNIIETVQAELYIIMDELFTLDNADELINEIIEYSKNFNKKFRIRVDDKISKHLDRLNKNIALEFEVKKTLNFDKIFFTRLNQYGIDYYYFLIAENLEDLKFNVRENPTYIFVSISKQKFFSKEESDSLLHQLSELENQDINMITDRDTYYGDSPNFDCRHYSNESITVIGDGTVILCPEFRDLSRFKQSFVNFGNLFKIGIERIITHLQNVRLLNMMVIKNKNGLGECGECLSYIRK